MDNWFANSVKAINAPRKLRWHVAAREAAVRSATLHTRHDAMQRA
jgi:hypothetical protein